MMIVGAESVTRKLKPVSTNISTALSTSTQDLIKSAIAAAKTSSSIIAKIVQVIKICIAAIL